MPHARDRRSSARYGGRGATRRSCIRGALRGSWRSLVLEPFTASGGWISRPWAAPWWHNRARNRRPIGFALQGPAGSPCAERFGEPSSEPHGARLLGLRGLDLTPGDRALDLKGPTPRL